MFLPTVGIKSATKSGYEVATESDSINFTHLNSKTRRGRVGHGVAQSSVCACNQGVIVKDNDISNPLKGKTAYGWHFEQKVYSEDSRCTRALTASEGSGSREKVLIKSKIEMTISKPLIYQTGRGYNKGGLKDVCPTITINSWERNNHLIDSFRIRRLTPRECFRLMGMRDEDIVLVNSDSQSYKIAGNGIEINTMRSIIRQLYKPVRNSMSLF